ncbi:MAG: hypothetical protein L0099_04485, partial [Acidobacteria bacterium]|nr:hypothetical protein [Acidobacteriota bacterium]
MPGLTVARSPDCDGSEKRASIAPGARADASAPPSGVGAVVVAVVGEPVGAHRADVAAQITVQQNWSEHGRFL